MNIEADKRVIRLTFKQWLEQNPDIRDDPNRKLKCICCGGTGICICHCGDEHECGNCYGKGAHDQALEEYVRIAMREDALINDGERRT